MLSPEELDPLWDCFPDQEAGRLRTVLDLPALLPSQAADDLEATLRQAARSLPLIVRAIRSYPAVDAHSVLGGSERDAATLIEAIIRADSGEMEFAIPTSAVLGRAFVQAKINFFKAIEHLSTQGGNASQELSAVFSEMVGDAVFSKLAEELLSAVLANPENPIDLKRAAGARLVSMWTNRLSMPVDELPSVLLSAWRARRRVRAVFGSLIGVTEIVSLIKAQCEPEFVDFFSRDEVNRDEAEAFREFLFGLPHEEIEAVRTYMRTHDITVVTPEEVRQIVRSSIRSSFLGYPSPDHMYASYGRRRTRAEYRVITGSPGPRKTAEGYIVRRILRDEIERAHGGEAAEG